jgi:hypothetical protein
MIPELAQILESLELLVEPGLDGAGERPVPP